MKSAVKNVPPSDPDNVALKCRPQQWTLFDIYLLLTVGRTDHSGDFTKGAGLSNWQALFIISGCGFNISDKLLRAMRD
jgi:hypothetical protein